ncbi:MAG: hypothetical protein IID39_08195 [Planctomycetes bacterium]|nr:hypothetical protein [Planctomycetota bacterium]
MKWEAEFPPGTPVRVRQVTKRRGRSLEAVVVGVVVEWESVPTGSWYVHGRKDRLWLDRLKLRKADGELTLLVIDDGTHLARLEPATD